MNKNIIDESSDYILGEIIYEQLAVKMVDFVLDAGGPKPVEAFGFVSALKRGPGHFDLGGAGDVGVLIGDRKAHFLARPGVVANGRDKGIGADVGCLMAVLPARIHDE